MIQLAPEPISVEMITDLSDPNYSYHDDYSRISSTMLKVFARSRKEFHWTYVLRKMKPKEPTPGMNLGSVCHGVFLEGYDVDEMVVVYPDCLITDSGRLSPKGSIIRDLIARPEGTSIESQLAVVPPEFITPSGNLSSKKGVAEWKEANAEKTIVMPSEADEIKAAFEKCPNAQYAMKQSDLDAAKQIVDVLLESDFAQWCTLDRAIAEQPIVWKNKASGLDCRCMPDLLVPNCVDPKTHVEFTFFADLKITIFWSRETFSTYLTGNPRFRGAQRGWVQAALYADGIGTQFGKPTSMRFVCANPQPPHQVRVNPISKISFDEMNTRYRKLMCDLDQCYQTDDWTDTDVDEQDIVLSPEDIQ